MKTPNEIDSKFRFVILASKRAKQLLGGTKPKVKTKLKNLIRVAQEEVGDGLIEFEIIKPKTEEIYEVDDGAFIGEELGEGVEKIEEVVDKAEPKKKKKKGPKKKKEAKKEKKEKPEK